MPPILKIYIYYFRVLHRKPRHQEHPQNVRKVQELIQSFLFCLWSVEAAKAPQAPNVGPSKKVLEMIANRSSKSGLVDSGSCFVYCITKFTCSKKNNHQVFRRSFIVGRPSFGNDLFTFRMLFLNHSN